MRDSTQHAGLFKATRCGEIAGCTGPHATARSQQVMDKLFGEEVMEEALVEFPLKSGMPTLTLSLASRTSTSTRPEVHHRWPPKGAGLTGRKIIIDPYGGWGPWWRRFL